MVPTALTLPTPRRAHPMWRDPDHLFASSDQSCSSRRETCRDEYAASSKRMTAKGIGHQMATRIRQKCRIAGTI
jgi:hypothetical protein